MINKAKSNEVLITVSGPDHPGITAALTKIIAQEKGALLDMGQAVTHGLLSLSILVRTQEEHAQDSSLLKEMLFGANKMGLHMDYKAISEFQLREEQGGEKFILSCVSIDALSAHFVHDIATVLASHEVNILRIDKISPKQMTSMEITTNVPDGLDLKNLKESLLKISSAHQVDVAFLKDSVYRRNKRLIIFDMDSTLIQAEVIDEMADKHGVGEEVKKITEEAMNGQIAFDESLKRRVSKLKGLEVERMKEILDHLPLTPGVEDFLKTVKSLGYKVAVISGGFSFFTDAIKNKLGLDYAFANELEVTGGKLTGELVGPIVNAEQKAMLLKMIAQQEKIHPEQVVAIGDGANDLPMLSAAGLGIAFHAKEIVKKKAHHHLSHGPMTSILYFLGIPGAESLK